MRSELWGEGGTKICDCFVLCCAYSLAPFHSWNICFQPTTFLEFPLLRDQIDLAFPNNFNYYGWFITIHTQMKHCPKVSLGRLSDFDAIGCTVSVLFNRSVSVPCVSCPISHFAVYAGAVIF